MQRVIIVGAGGHAQVVADILLCRHDAGGQAEPVGYVDDDAALEGRTPLGIPVLGPIAALASFPHNRVIIAVGSNERRRDLFQRLASQGERFATAIHPSAIIARDAVIGTGSVVAAGAIVNPGAVIGSNVILNTACSVDHHNIVEDHAHVAPGVRLGGDVHIGEGVLVGIGAAVMPQRRVGAWSTVGAGALVQRDIPPGVVAIGVPARVVERPR